MSRRARWRLAVCLTGLGVGSCGSDKPPPVLLEASGFWNEDPGTVAQTGFQVWADVDGRRAHRRAASRSPRTSTSTSTAARPR